MKKKFTKGPIIVGGVGGSGTRTIAEILKQSGVFMGSALNNANDNMTLAPKFPIMRDLIQCRNVKENQVLRKLVTLFFLESVYKKLIIHKTLSQFEKRMFLDYIKNNDKYIGWGWKVPGNFIVLKYIVNYFHNTKYIHIIRNGLDMAFSSNQNQLHNWGDYYNVNKVNQSLPQISLDFWYRANKKAIEESQNLLKNNFLLIRFEELCYKPKENISKILDFARIKEYELDNLIELVKIPETIGRYKKNDLSTFNKADYNKLTELGYNK